LLKETTGAFEGVRTHDLNITTQYKPYHELSVNTVCVTIEGLTKAVNEITWAIYPNTYIWITEPVFI